ncbi:MAG: hypothetical protein RIC35_06660 [Marinoscillum sp.]
MKYLSFFVLAITIISCTNPKGESQTEEKDLKTQVLDAHDEVMPKMGELRATQKKLLVLADSMSADSVVAAKYQALANDIKLANEAMMDWMRSFDANYQGTEKEMEVYLQGQLKTIEKVRDDMNTSLEAGKKALEE